MPSRSGKVGPAALIETLRELADYWDATDAEFATCANGHSSSPVSPRHKTMAILTGTPLPGDPNF